MMLCCMRDALEWFVLRAIYIILFFLPVGVFSSREKTLSRNSIALRFQEATGESRVGSIAWLGSGFLVRAE
jgi:hypothetical protein